MSTVAGLGEARVARLRTLADLNRLISSSLDADDVLRVLARAAAELMDAPAASFWIADEAARRITLRAWERSPLRMWFPSVSVAYGANGVGWVAQHRRVLNVDDVRNDDRVVFTEWLRENDLTSFLGVPVAFGDTLLAVLGMNGRHPFQLGPEEEALLDVFVAQAAAALHNARLHAEVRRTRELFRAIAELSPDGIVTTDVEGRITSCSPRAEAMLGRHAAEVVGRPLGDYWGGENGDGEALARRLAAPEEIRHHEASIRSGDGRVLRMVGSVTSLRETGGAMSGRVAVIRDVTDERLAETERARLEAQLRETRSLEAIAWLTGGIADDVEGALAGILERAARIREELGERHPGHAHVDAIEAAARRAAAFADVLGACGAPEPSGATLLDLNATIGELTPMLRRLLGDAIDLRIPLAQAPGAVRVDRRQLGRLIMRLAMNARAAMPAGGRLTIETAHADGRITLTVSGTGIGVSDAAAAGSLEPFVDVVTRAGGAIEVESAPGGGTTVRIVFPRAEPAPGPAPDPTPRAEPAELPTGRETILLVDDDHLVREFTREMLTRDGYTVLEARDGAEALRLAAGRAEPIHLLLTDVVMPELSGINTAALLAGAHPEMRILYMSGYTDDAILRNGVAQGEVSFLAKPFTRRTLAVKVREVLERPRGA